MKTQMEPNLETSINFSENKLQYNKIPCFIVPKMGYEIKKEEERRFLC